MTWQLESADRSAQLAVNSRIQKRGNVHGCKSAATYALIRKYLPTLLSLSSSYFGHVPQPPVWYG
jgi:hypothetical protein